MEMDLGWVTIALSIGFAVLLVRLLLGDGSSSRTRFPPGPRGLPLLGNLLQVDLSALPSCLMEFSKKYGPVFSLRLGGHTVVVLTGYQAVRDALVGKAEEFSSRPIVPMMHYLGIDKGLVLGSGAWHRTLRRFSISTLRDFGVGRRSIEERISEESECLLKRISTLEGKAFEPTFFFNSAVSNVICSVIYGDRFDYDNATFVKLLAVMNKELQLLGSIWTQLYNAFPLLRYIPGPQLYMAKESRKIANFVRGMISQHQSVLDTSNPQDYIDAFLVKQAKENNMPETGEKVFTNDHMTFATRSLFVAGSETTSTTLRCASLIMIKHPDVQARVHAEIDRVLGVRAPTMADRENLPYTNAVIHEIQRFSDIIPMNIPHATTTDVEFNGFLIPKGTHIIPLLHSVHRDAKEWATPYDFNPSHFLDENGGFVKRDAFMAFSAGRRACLGESLARTELFIFFTGLLQHFTFKAPIGTPHPDLTPQLGTIASPKPYALCALKR
uniref:cytochrome P450 2F2-like n=1 Tax=Myxine glutinosa TaxID=7769 RepID=UPI00358F7EA7